jgi:para-nitrobenzyl esterase
VRDSVGAFGGDAGNVTVFGESAGGMSVADLLAAPAARGLFRRAIVQSGPPNALPAARAQETAAKLLAELGAAGPDKLRDVPVESILQAQSGLLAQRGAGGLPLTPVVDGAVLPDPPARAVADGCAADIPLLIGTNRDEAKLFMVADPKNRDPDDDVVRRRIERAFAAGDVPLSAADAIDAYRAARAARGENTDPREIWSAIETDRMFRIGSVRAAEDQSAHQPRTYSYLFTWESPAMGGALGACHAVEIPFVFGNLDSPGMDRFAGQGPAADALSGLMMDAWLAFARTGDPAHSGLGEWPAYEPSRRATMAFGPDTHVEDAPYEEERQLWEAAS